MTGTPPTVPDEILLHGSCVAIGERGVLLLGPPGAGKSDLILRLLDQPGYGIDGKLKTARLVADDQVIVSRGRMGLEARAPAAIAGKLEVRGLGIVEVPHAERARLGLAFKLVPASEIERLPDLERVGFDVLGMVIPLVLVDPSQASAPARVRAALDWLGRR